MKTNFTFQEIETAFSSGHITLSQLYEILADNYGKKKARKILRNNLDIKLKEEGMLWPERQKHLQLISLLV